LRGRDNYIIILHYGGYQYNKYSYNLGTTIKSILKDMGDINEIICIYNKKDNKAINLLHDFKRNISNLDDDEKKSYIEGRNNINEDNIEIYINNHKIPFNYKNEGNEIGQIKVKFKFKKL